MNKTNAIYLGVNIDHVATLRQARLTRYPDPIQAVFEAEKGGADGITIHLREDRRHIQERDVELVGQVLLTRLNFEMALTPAMIAYAIKIKPTYCCLVPEKREELTTEGGLDVSDNVQKVKEGVSRLQDENILVSLFIDPDFKQIDAAKKTGATHIEIHTGAFADAQTNDIQEHELDRIIKAAHYAHDCGLIVNAGHGLNYQNVAKIASIPVIHELNIGHGIVAQALFVGFREAVKEMKTLMLLARQGVIA